VSKNNKNKNKKQQNQKLEEEKQQQQEENIQLEISRIERENKNIMNNLFSLENEERVVVNTKSDCLRQLAKNYEKLHGLGAYKGELADICSTICEELRRRNLWASESLAHKALDSKYKRTEHTPYTVNPEPSPPTITTEEWVPSQSPTVHYYYGDDTATKHNDNITSSGDFHVPKQDKPIDEMSSDELRDITENLIKTERKATENQRELRRRRRDYLTECIKRKVALSPEYDQLSREPHISTEVDESGISEAWEALEDLKEILTKVQDKVWKFKPDKKMAKMMAEAIREEIRFWEPVADEKYRKDQVSWWEVQLDNIWHGKHAAAIMNATILDDKTKRSLTREQVGDKAEEALLRAIRFAAAQKMKMAFHLWYIERVEKPIAKRAKDLHQVLSEQSFT